MKTKTPLEEYLFKDSNSHSKESLVNNKLFYDLKLAAAKADYFLNIYTPEVDKDGFDIILDDQDQLLKVQLKTVMEKTTTNSWNIHKSLLRPHRYVCEDLGFESSPSGTGYQGGVIVIELEDSERSGLQLSYYYTDIIIICGLRDGIIDKATPPILDTMKKFTTEINSGPANEKMPTPKSFFLKANSAEDLLALMGIHSPTNSGSFRYNIQQLVSKASRTPQETVSLKAFINRELRQLSASIAPLPDS